MAWCEFWEKSLFMMTSSNGNIFRVTGPLCGEITGHQWIPLTKASDVELWCFLWFALDWVNNREAGALRCHRTHYDINVMDSKAWWRHQMETFSALLVLCAGNSPVPVNSPHKGQWRGALMFSLICTWINAWVNNPEAGDLRRHRAHYDVIAMMTWFSDDYFLPNLLP